MKPETVTGKRILFSALNWGMGHVSRSISLIDQLLSQNNSIFVACDSRQQEIYECYFDELVFIDHRPYPFKFQGKGFFITDLIKSYRGLNRRLKSEIRETEEYVQEFKIDLVLSDHRYGFFSSSVPSVFITHQVHLPLKWYQFPAVRFHRKYLRKFSFYWIMDTSDSELAGKLSLRDGSGKEIYIGHHSRFRRYTKRPEKDIEALLICSGPQVYAQQLVDSVISKGHEGLIIIGEDKLRVPDSARLIQGDWKVKDECILRARHIISRSGYSTIMDVKELGITADFFATPGQYEQEYLAELHGKSVIENLL